MSSLAAKLFLSSLLVFLSSEYIMRELQKVEAHPMVVFFPALAVMGAFITGVASGLVWIWS